MTSTWHRTEPRDVRPFFETTKAEHALADSGIRLNPGVDVSYETSFDLDEIDFQKLEPMITVALVDPSLWLPAGLAAAEIELVLVARHSLLKLSEVLARFPLSNSMPGDLSVGPDVLTRFGGGRNLELTLALCLATDREPIPGTVFVPGHWLARKSFVLRSRTFPALFDLRTRSDDDWRAADYPAKTFFAVEYAGGIAEEMEDGSSIATVYVHIDAHNKMTNSPLGDALQPILASEIILSIVLTSFDDWKEIETLHSDSPLATLAKQLGGDEPLSLNEMKKLANDPPRLRAKLQDRLTVVRALQ